MKNVQVTVIMPSDLRDILDALAKDQNRSLSGQIVHLLRREVGN